MTIEGIIVNLIWLVIVIGVIALVYWALTQLFAALNAPPVVAVVLRIVCVLVAALILIYWILGNLPPLRAR